MATQQDNITIERVEKAIMGFAPMVALGSETAFDDVRRTIRIFMRKHPEIFWFSHQYLYDENTGILRFKYNFTEDKADFFKREIGKVVKYDFQIDYVKSLSEIERLVYVYKWIANRTTYNEYSSFNQTIYSVLVNRNSVCTGYAKTAQYLLNLVGIESELVFGKFHSDKSEHGRHGWNIVKINDKWYHIDFCLADGTLSYLLSKDESPIENNSILWNYFGVPTDKILSNRSIEFIETLPECKDTILGFPEVELCKPRKQLICCKSDSGTSSRIYLDSSNKNRVIKVSRNDQTELLNNEAATLSMLCDCQHIIKSYGLNESGLSLEQLTPWSELLNSHYYNPTESDLRNILCQLIEGLIECKDNGISYSDIHYNNVFVTRNGIYKWGDFGIAFPYQSHGKLPPEMIGGNGKAKGSYWFMAPETYHQNVFTEASAIYSVAMMAYFIMNDMRPPFWTDDEHQQEALVQRLNGRDIPKPVFYDRFRNLWPIIHKALSFPLGNRFRGFTDFRICICANIGDNGSASSCKYKPEEDNYRYGYSHSKPTDDSYAATKGIDLSVEDYRDFASTKRERWGDGAIHDIDSFARTCGVGDSHIPPFINDDFATTAAPNFKSAADSESEYSSHSQKSRTGGATYGICESQPTEKRSIWSKLFGKKEKSVMVNASAYAPAEISPYRYFIVRVFVHLPEESKRIDQSVKDIDKTAIKKANKPLGISAKEGDRITVQLSLTDGIRIDEPMQNGIWRGRYMEFDFGCELVKNNLYTGLGKAIIAINNAPCGDLKFTIDVVMTAPQKVYAPVETRRYSKIFISYAHADYSQVRGIAEGCKMNGTDYFFDRHTLRPGDIFKDKILEYIDNADLFVLCWSKNAAESKWVQIERKYALELIERGNHQLAIYPLSMPPEAPLPADMSDKYNFATL